MSITAVLISGYLQGGLHAAKPDTLYSVSYSNTSLDAVLLDLVETTDIDLVYNPDLTEGKRITLEMTESPAEAILEAVMFQAGLEYHLLESGTYVINLPVQEQLPPPPPPAVIQGKVLDSETGQPAANVRIISAGQLPAVVTDSTGLFRYTNVQTGVHLLVAQKKGYGITFQRVEVKPGTTADVQLLLMAEKAPVEVPEMPVAVNMPVFNSVIARSYSQNPLVFPEWNGTGHDAWLATLPGIVTLKPVTGYHSLSFWSPDHSGSAQGLFLFAGRLPAYTAGGYRYRHGPEMNSSGVVDLHVVEDHQKEFSANIEISDVFLEGGISAGSLMLMDGEFRADAGVRMINPVTSGSRMIDDLTGWLYSETETGLNASVVDDGSERMEAGLIESVINLEYTSNNRVTSGLSLNSGNSNLDVNRQEGPYLMVPLSDSFDSRYTEVSQFIRYDAGSRGTFHQKMNYRYAGMKHQVIANMIAELFYGSFKKNEFSVEAGYTGALSQKTGLRATYRFERGTYEADFDSGIFTADSGDDNPLTDHRLSVDVTMEFQSGLSVTPGIRVLHGNRAGTPVFDPGVSVTYTMPGYNEEQMQVRAGWHQLSDYRHRFKLPVPVGSTPVPFYDITLTSQEGDKPVVVSYSYLEGRYRVNETLHIRVFARHGLQKDLRRPDFLTGSAGSSGMLNHRVHLTDSREYRFGGVLYGYSKRAGLEAGLSYSYGDYTERSTVYYSGKRVQAAENVPHQVQMLAQWRAGKDFNLELRWESGFGRMTRALHDKYYQYRPAPGDLPVPVANPESGDYLREPWHRLDAGIVKGQMISDVKLLIKLQFMNILNRKNYIDTIIITDLNSPEPRYSFLKRRMPGFYPQFSVKAEF